MKPNKYPNVTFKLDDGRTVKLHALAWEPSYDEEKEFRSGDDCRDLVIRRKRLKTEALFCCDGFHMIRPEYVGLYINDPPRIQNTAITVLLSSTPISEEAVYSELIVLFFMDYVEGSSIESMLAQELHDLDWEKHAADITEETVRFLEEFWLDNTVH